MSHSLFRFRSAWEAPFFVLAAAGLALLAACGTSTTTFPSITGNITVSTVTGEGGVAGSADTNASNSTVGLFNAPQGIAIDSLNGCGYVADTGNNMIRAFSLSNTQGYNGTAAIYTIAGSTTAGSTDAVGTNATFNAPTSIAVDSTGMNLYVTDYNNHTIRKLSLPSGTTPTCTSTANDATQVWTVTTFAGTAGGTGATDDTGAGARFRNPRGVTIDNSNTLYVTDSLNCEVRKITTPGAVVTTIAGNSRCTTLIQPLVGIGASSSGTVYLVDNANCSIYQVTNSNLSLLAGQGTCNYGFADGAGSAARFMGPLGLAISAAGKNAGNLYIYDSYYQALRQVTPTGVTTTLSTGGGWVDGAGTVAKFNTVWGMTSDSSGNLYLADTNNHVIRKIVFN